jgi:transcriptional regulator with XRE-family HTH domain
MLLSRLPETSAQIASAVGVSRQAVDYWRHGEKKPDTGKRGLLQQTYGVSASAWDEYPEVRSEPKVQAAPTTGGNALDRIEQTALAFVDQVFADTGATMKERAAALDKASITVARISKAKAEQAANLLRSPDWLRAYGAIREVLSEAAPELLERLERRMRELDEALTAITSRDDDDAA